MIAKRRISNVKSPRASKTRVFRTELQSANGAGRWSLVPEVVANSFVSKRPAVRGTVNSVPFRSRLAVYSGKSYLGFTAAIRSQAQISLGDMLQIELESDDAPREIELPSELKAVLTINPMAKAAFEKLSFTCRKEYVVWISSAKREETRERRVKEALTLLAVGKKTPR